MTTPDKSSSKRSPLVVQENAIINLAIRECTN